MTIEILDAGQDLKPVVLNLGLYYIHDFTDFLGFRCPDSGLYRTDCWEKYWAGAEPLAFLVKVDGELAGFVMVETEGVLPQSQFSVGEFFIMRKFRRRGLGQKVAFHIFDRFKGRWEVRQVIQNNPATVFWRKVIDRYTSGRWTQLPEPVHHGQWVDTVQTFDNSIPLPPSSDV